MSLDVGDKAPAFAIPADEGEVDSLEALSGKTLVLYFYPRDDTPGCTKEACGYRDALPDFSRLDAEVIGVSKDSVAKHAKFETKHDLTFRLASDENSDVCERYGVWSEKNMYERKFMGVERSTFLIDGRGIVRSVWRKVRVPGHVEQVLDAARGL